ncbi:hypothetical protein ACLOJK_026345 [Asimina triloba]
MRWSAIRFNEGGDARVVAVEDFERWSLNRVAGVEEAKAGRCCLEFGPRQAIDFGSSNDGRRPIRMEIDGEDNGRPETRSLAAVQVETLDLEDSI